MSDVRKHKKKHKTNVETIVDLMEWSKSGPMMQLFVIESIMRYATEVSKTTAADDPPGHSFINPEAWRRCAREALEVMNNHLGVKPAALEAGGSKDAET